MDSSHKSLRNSIFVMDDLCQRSEAIGRTRGIGNNICLSSIILVVYPNDIHGSIGRRSRDDNLLCTTTKVRLSLLSGGEDAGRLAHVGCADGSPWDVRGVLLREELDDALVLTLPDNKRVGLLISHDASRELAVHRIILEEVASIVKGEEGIVHSDRCDITFVLKSSAAHEATNAAESVDSNFDGHG